MPSSSPPMPRTPSVSSNDSPAASSVSNISFLTNSPTDPASSPTAPPLPSTSFHGITRRRNSRMSDQSDDSCREAQPSNRRRIEDHLSANETSSRPASFLIAPPGSPGLGTLLASTNPDRAVPRAGNWPVRDKALPILPAHPILPIWEPILIPAIMALIDRHQLPFTSLNLLRIYYPSSEWADKKLEEESAPTVIWIGVGVNSEELSEEDAEEFVNEVAGILRENGFADVFVEIHHAGIELQTGPFLPNRPTSRSRDIERLFQLRVGMNIAPISKPMSRGTGGLFLRLGSSHELYLLTCQHVVCSSHDLVRHPMSSLLGEPVSLFSQAGFEDLTGDLREELDRQIEHVAESIKILGLQDSATTDEEEEEISLREAELKVATARRNALGDLLDTITKDLSDPSDRVFGSVFCHPAFVNDVPPKNCPEILRRADGTRGGWCQDWSLIQLHNDLATTVLPNTIYLQTRPSDRTPITAKFFSPHSLLKDRIMISTVATFSASSETSIPVFKTGASSQDTLGYQNPAVSVLRQSNDSDKYIDGASVSKRNRDTFVVPFVGIDPLRPFSQPGDSGSVIVDRDGRALAMITAGSMRGGIDVSYGTPMDFIFEQIELFTGSLPTLA